MIPQKPPHLSGNLWQEITSAPIEKLRAYLKCEAGSCFMSYDKWENFISKHGIPALDAIIQDWLDYQERDQEARELCFRRAEETRKAAKEGK